MEKKDALFANLTDQNGLLIRLVDTYKEDQATADRQIGNLKEQITNYQAIEASLEKSLRWQKRYKWLGIGGGAALAVLAWTTR